MTTTTCFRVALVVLALSVPRSVEADHLPCEDTAWCGGWYCRTSQLWLEAEAVSGVPNDVVPVTIWLHYAPEFDWAFSSIEVAVCHDPAKVEIVGAPVYSEEVLARNPLNFFEQEINQDERAVREIAPGVVVPSGVKGYGYYANVGAMRLDSFSGAMPVLTLYYRIIGEPGQTTEISLCDAELANGPGSCLFNGVWDSGIDRHLGPLLSLGNRNGSIAIHDGPVTRPERPPEPPAAVVYAEAPSSEEVNLRVRFSDAVAAPGDRGVPIEVFVRADVEYTGIVVPIDFDERYLRVVRVEDSFLSGTAVLDNEDAQAGAQADEGYVVIASSLGGKRRIALAGEEFHAATLYVDVLESAAAVPETTLESRPVGGRAPDPFVIVRHRSGAHAGQVETTSEIGAVTISGGLLAIRASRSTLRGDANFDGVFDISDPVSVLGFLFLGDRDPLCPGAADYSGDGQTDISDAIGMLGVLFLGTVPPGTGGAGEVDCRRDHVR